MILAYVERIVDEWQIPTLFVSHSQAEVRRLAQWVVVVDRGKLVTAGRPEEALIDRTPLGWRDALAPMNLLRIDTVRLDGEHWVGQVGEQLLHLPAPPHPAAGPVWVQLSPGDVMLGRQDVTGLSARNQLRGTIRKIVADGERSFVAVDVGQVIWSLVTPESVVELGLAPGVEVTCLIKTHSLQVLSS